MTPQHMNASELNALLAANPDKPIHYFARAHSAAPWAIFELKPLGNGHPRRLPSFLADWQFYGPILPPDDGQAQQGVQNHLEQDLEMVQPPEPVAAQCRFIGDDDWRDCTIDHHLHVQDHPNEWPNYETRLLYTQPPVPRDVLMQVANKVREACEEYGYDCGFVDIAPIVDRYATQPPAQPRCACGDSFTVDAMCANCIAAAQPPAVADRDAIRRVFMAHGFTIKDGQTDLKPYVYEAAEALLRELSPAVAVPDDAAILAHFHAAKDPDAHLHSDQREVVYQLTQEELLQAARAMLEAAPKAVVAIPVTTDQQWDESEFMMWVDSRHLQYLPEIQAELFNHNAPESIRNYFKSQTMYRWYPSEIKRALAAVQKGGAA
jgi:hypothetical protein